MSKPDTKRIKTDNDPEYELIYWPGIPGRGELIRVLFEEAGVPYKDTAKDENQGAAVANVLNQMESKDSPIFACPALRHKDNLFFQTANILMYIAPKLGLAPTESSIASFHLNQIVLTILDGLVAEAHDTHHPVSVGLTYEEQKPEAKKKAKAFTQERLPKFLAYLQRVIDANSMSGDELWLYGSTLTYADLVLFQVSSATLARGRVLEDVANSHAFKGS